MPKAQASKAKKKDEEVIVREITITIQGAADISVSNETVSDTEMVGILTVLLDAYKARFNKAQEAPSEN